VIVGETSPSYSTGRAAKKLVVGKTKRPAVGWPGEEPHVSEGLVWGAAVFLHRVSRHFEGYDIDFVLVSGNMCFERDVVSFVAFDRIRVADRPALAVFVAYEGLSVVADFARDAGSFRGYVGFRRILLHRVLSH
jgi:hypothetical protein